MVTNYNQHIDMKLKFLSILLGLFTISSFAQSPTFEWVREVEIAGTNFSNSDAVELKIDQQGNSITTGYFTGVIDFNAGPGTATLNSNGMAAGFVQKLNTNGDFLWVKKIGSTSQSALATALALDNSGNVYVTGYFYSTVDFDPGAGVANLTSLGGPDVFVMMLDTNGNFVWVKQFGGVGTQISQSLAVDGSGNVSVVGIFLDTADFNPGTDVFNMSPSSYSDIFITKLNSNGDFIWSKQIGNTDPDSGIEDIVAHNIDAEGNIFITSSFYQTIDADPGSEVLNLTSTGNTEVFILKLDLDGSFVWVKTVGSTFSSGYVTSRDIEVDDESNILIAGQYGASADMDPGPGLLQYVSTGYDSYILKLDSEGNFVWVRTVTGTSNDAAFALATNSSGDCYVTGYFDENADFESGPNTTSLLAAGIGSTLDIYVLKLHSDGDFGWVIKLGTVYDDFGTSIDVDDNGNVYTYGEYRNNPQAFSYPEIDFDPGPGVYYLTSDAEIPQGFFVHKMSQCTPSVFNDVQVACDSFTWTNGVTYTAPNNSATQTLISATGCDSIVNLFLTLNVSSFSTQNQTACDAYTWPLNGTTYTNSGTYTVEGTNEGGCPQITTLNLTITNIDATTSLSGITLTANASGAQYQWVNCNNNNAPIFGQTNQTFTPTASGNYAVIVSEGNCTATSNCVNVIVSGIEEIVNSTIDIYPNPANESVTITSSHNIQKIELMNALGQVVQLYESLAVKTYSFVLPNESGTYFVKIFTENGIINRRVVKG